MTINKTCENNKLKIALEGRLDTTTAPQLDEEVKNIDDNITSVLMDMKNLEYVSSAGLRVILSLHKKMMKKDGLIIKNVNDTIKEVFEITGFSDILTIE